jgi:hypothetical protein
MSIIEQINCSTSQEEIIQLLEEHVIDIETPRSWGEEAAILEREGKKDKAEILRAAEKRWFELEYK